MVDSEKYEGICNGLAEYVETNIIPLYDSFDSGHRREHVRKVIANSLAMTAGRNVNREMVYTAAAYHDTGLTAGRENHHIESGKIIRCDANLHRWFTPDQIETVAQAAEDHRASADNRPRSIYGLIVAEADRDIEPLAIIRRTVQYGLSHYPELDCEGHWQRTVEHLNMKYAEGGYMHLWLDDSPNAAGLAELRSIINDTSRLRDLFDRSYRRQRVLDFLDRNSIPYTLYNHPPLFTIDEALEYWKEIRDCVHCKNLFFRNHKGNRHYLVSFECHKQMDIHSLEHVLHQGKLSFASKERMERCLGLSPGSVSPLGLINDMDLVGADPKELFANGHRVKFYLDSDLQKAGSVSFHPADNMASVVLKTGDFMRFLELWNGEWEWFCPSGDISG